MALLGRLGLSDGGQDIPHELGLSPDMSDLGVHWAEGVRGRGVNLRRPVVPTRPADSWYLLTVFLHVSDLTRLLFFLSLSLVRGEFGPSREKPSCEISLR